MEEAQEKAEQLGREKKSLEGKNSEKDNKKRKKGNK
jgi:hypothetical protein